MTIVITNSDDGTVDLLLRHVKNPQQIFRYNHDLFSQYIIDIRPDGFTMSDPLGREITESTATKCYIRKPASAQYPPGEEHYIEQEKWAALRSLVYFLQSEHKVVLFESFESARTNKLNQLRVAKKHFAVVDARITNRPENTGPGDYVVKSLSGGTMGEKTLYTARVAQPGNLKSGLPWYIQPYIDASHDVTVVYLYGDCYAYQYDRSQLPVGIIDYRSVLNSWDAWQFVDLPIHQIEAIRSFMEEMDLVFGRLDFLLTPERNLCFLEINANGQFGWLDPSDKHGLLTRIASELI